MPPSGPSAPSGPSNLKKVPPSGPKAQHAGIPRGPAASRPTPVAIPFGAGKRIGAYVPNNIGNDRNGYTSPAHAQYNRSPYSQTFGQSNGFDAGSSNGYSSPSAHAESSRQALSKPAPRGPASESRDKSRRYTSQTPIVDRSNSNSRDPINRQESQETSTKSLLPTQNDPRTPIKIAFPSFKLNGPIPTEPKPPRLPPPPPSDRPPTPPLEDQPPPPPSSPPRRQPNSPPPPPPPPPEDAAPPSPPRPSPEKKLVPIPEPARIPVPEPPKKSNTVSPFSLPSITADDPPPPPRSSSPPLAAAAAAPISISLPAQPTSKVAPPAFHFRDIPVRRRSPTPADDDEAEDESRPASPPPREPTPREPTPPPYVPEPYVAPASVSCRPGLGNFRITFDPALDDPKKGKEVKRRFDGEGLDAIKDPRLDMPLDVRRRGRGPAKQRVELQEIDYTWDSNSVGAKPLPLPCAVLVTGLSPLTTTDQIGKFFRAHGRIREMDSKMDTRSGMQLGICWVKFDSPPPTSGKTAHDIAKTVVRLCDGQRIRMQGDEKIRVVLDGRGLRAQKAVKEEMERRYKPKPKPLPKVAPPPPTAPTPKPDADTPKTDRPMPQLPLPPKPSYAVAAGVPKRPPPQAVPLYNNRNYSSLNRAQPIQPSFASTLPGRPGFNLGQRPNYPTMQTSRPGKFLDLRDSYSPPRGRSPVRRYRNRSRHNSHSTGCTTCSSDYDSEDDRYDARHYRPRRTPSPRRDKPSGPSKEDEAAIERVKKALGENGKSHIFIDEQNLSTKDVTTSEFLRDHFRAFHPKQILASPKGWYILFDKEGVAQNAAILKGTAFRGRTLQFVIEAGVPTVRPIVDSTSALSGRNHMPIAKKKRSVAKPIAKKIIKKRAPSFSSSSGEEPSDDERPLVEDKTPVQEKAETPVVVEDVVMAEEAGVISKKRGGRPKGSKNKKQKLEPAPLVEISKSDEPPLVEIKLPTKIVKPPKAVASPIDKLIVDGTVVDEEDAYWLGQALAELEPDEEGDLAEVELVSEDHPLHHQSGSWRAEGFKQIPKTRKSEYLPQQNKGKVEQDNPSLTSGRTARVTGRRLAHDIDASRKATTAQTSETDTFAFNQLRTRKKQLKFSRSPIEGYGLYAMESIAVGEMICEYVGDIIRSSVAEIREQRYLKQGIGSSYLFRIDGDVVCDATFRGSVSRLINHSCDPSASAKIITINGQSKIVIYARTQLHPGQEILYDYKFPLEDDPALRVPCLCGAATCRGWLN